MRKPPDQHDLDLRLVASLLDRLFPDAPFALVLLKPGMTEPTLVSSARDAAVAAALRQVLARIDPQAPAPAVTAPAPRTISSEFLRVQDVLALLPMSKSTWWRGVRSGQFPAPVKLGAAMTAWRAADIAKLIEQLNGDQG